MIKINKIKHLHLELSSRCNARCPLCPRNTNGYPFNRGFDETDLKLEIIKKSFSDSFIKNLDEILLNGNFGDFVMNKESLDIIKYFVKKNSNLKITISTNGSARSKEFWTELGKIPNVECQFCIDGLESTHSIYRQDTNFSTIIQNAKYFIQSGGNALWKMIKFNHNEKDIVKCIAQSKKLGFTNFILIDHGRNTGPVFDRTGNFLRKIGKYEGTTNINEIIQNHDTILDNFDKTEKITNDLDCYTLKHKSIYIDASANVYPCCWLGFSPNTFKDSYFSQSANQYKNFIKKNNLHENTLEECLDWFSHIEKSWSKDTYKDGRLHACDNFCKKTKEKQ